MDTGTLSWDPYDVRFAADPWPVFNRIRTEAPLYYKQTHDFYALSRCADVERALTDWETFSSSHGVVLELIKANIEMPPGTLIMEDPPVHNIHRQLLARIFSPRRFADLEPQVRQYGVRCLDPARGRVPVRPDREAGPGDADAGHRHAARHPRRGPSGLS